MMACERVLRIAASAAVAVVTVMGTNAAAAGLGLLAATADADPAAVQDAPDAPSAKVTIETLLDELLDEERATRLPAVPFKSRLWSSHNRKKTAPDKPGWFANGDCNQFIRDEQVDGHTEHVMAETDGPGAITRFWATVYKGHGTLRIYVDGKKVVEEDILKVLSGGLLCGAPLSTSQAAQTPYEKRGHTLYLPIPFAGRLKVTYELPKKAILYYNLETRTYPSQTAVESFSAERLAAARPAIERVNAALAAGKTQPPGECVDFAGELEPGTCVTRDVKGPAAIRALELNAGTDAALLRWLYLELVFDGERTVFMPVSAFFSVGDRLAPYSTWNLGATAAGDLSIRWPMPFARTALIRLHNLSTQRLAIARGSARVAPYAWDEARSLHFGATWNPNRGLWIGLNAETDVRVCDLTGQGYVVGVAASVRTHDPVLWWGEGNEKVVVDGERVPSFIGTGSEDHYGFAWSNRNPFSHPFFAQPVGIGESEIGVAQVLRQRQLDVIPFTRSIRYDMELLEYTGNPRTAGHHKIDFSQTAWWYMRPGGSSLGAE